MPTTFMRDRARTMNVAAQNPDSSLRVVCDRDELPPVPQGKSEPPARDRIVVSGTLRLRTYPRTRGYYLTSWNPFVRSERLIHLTSSRNHDELGSIPSIASHGRRTGVSAIVI
jgi:hypothetical protein